MRFLRKGKDHLKKKHDKVWLLATILILLLCGGVLWMVMRGATSAHASASNSPDGIGAGSAPPAAEPAAQGRARNIEGGTITQSAPAEESPPAPAVTLSDATRDKILTYIRERFGVPDTVKLTLGALQASTVAPGFNQAAVTVDEGKNQRAQLVLVSKDVALPDRGDGQHY